jgi:hypothetical protein
MEALALDEMRGAIAALTGAGEEPDAATDYYHAEMQRLCGEVEVAQKTFACGCIICTCEDPVQCHGCGAKRCRKPAAECEWLNERSAGEGEP